ncbi:helicase-associated domain-containing protein [Actinomycetospora aeridis]|uniref:Helicase-associated domain-containing protein n=1 Tax=Actinomycetospora aeridis TaxID=3129231 RepID=A0ABU8N7K8_9PSEU
MGTGLADHLAALDTPSLAALLEHRPDACAEPVPRDLGRLADRLAGRGSLAAALRRLDKDTVEVGRTLAVLGQRATPHAVMALLDADPALIERPLRILTRSGMAWPDGDVLRLPEPLSEHWHAEIGADEPLARMARHVVADEVRRIAVAQGIPLSTRKAEVVQAIHDAWSDPGFLRGVLDALPASARRRLGTLRRHEYDGLRPSTDDHLLLDAGLLVLEGHVARIPREVAVASWAADAHLTGVPDLPAPSDDPDRVRAGAVAAARSLLDTVTTVLDDAADHPLTALKSGGVGKRERTRLVKRLDLDDDHLAVLVLDLAAHAGLLGLTDAGYAPTAAYAAWREEDAAPRWTRLATTWFGLEYAPGRREVDGKEVAPPTPLISVDGDLRRALLAAAGDRSVHAAGENLGWFCPAPLLDETDLADVIAVTRREAEMLGVVVGDSVSPLGRALVDGGDVGELLVDAAGAVVLQSDLTAMVSGRVGAAVRRLLADAATPESRGAATTYRFSPASVRAALDAGWTADGLLADLRGLSERPLPQPLEYLVHDVARRHGHVRVRPAGACLVLEEALSEEVLRTRALRSLGLTRLAPTVLVSPSDPDAVLRALRGAGYLPVREDETGALVVERRESRVADAPAGPAGRDGMAPDVLAAQLLAAGVGNHLADSPTAALLGALNPRLALDELDLLADAVDHSHDVRITYSDRNGTISHRVVTPEEVFHRSLVAWCHLRDGEREFTVANILQVAPA